MIAFLFVAGFSTLIVLVARWVYRNMQRALGAGDPR